MPTVNTPRALHALLRRALRPALGSALALVAAVAASGCGDSKTNTARKVEPVAARDVPRVLRGTVGAECAIRGVEPQLVSGFGIVVGLNGTGGGELDPRIAATMERELARGGVSQGSSFDLGGMQGVTPKSFLRDPNVAVVIVEAAIPPGAPLGSTFDVRVRTLPGSSVTSLEGGKLWTTELRLGPASIFGSVRTRILGEASGPIFINPFAEPGAASADGVPITRTVGRVLGGGKVTEPLRLLLVLDQPSHARARSISNAVNARFPQGPGDPDPIGRGRDAQGVSLAVPWTYRENPAEFLQLVRYLRIDSAYPEEFARAYVDALKEQPGLADDISWCLQALGRPALPFMAALYDYPELAPRMAALRAGARLGDARVTDHLIEIARAAPPLLRTQAINLLADMPPNPAINLALRELVNEPDLGVKVAAYEGLSARSDLALNRFEAASGFVVEEIASKEPLIYVTQQGVPRIAILGGTLEDPGLELARPSIVRAWSDRLMMDAPGRNETIRLFYRDYRTREAETYTPPVDLSEFIAFAAHTPTPEDPRPGLKFTYSEVVGALYEFSRQGGLLAPFATEEDRLRSELFDAARSTELTDRPETTAAADEAGPLVFKVDEPKPLDSVGKPEVTSGAGEKKSMVVPLTRKAKPKAE